MKRIKPFLAGLTGLCACLQAQVLPTTTVWAQRLSLQGGNQVRYSDTLNTAHQAYPSLAQMLRQSSLWVRESSSGQYASVSFRGLSSSHTQVLWEGIPLQSPALGVFDFNLAPASMGGSVQFLTGGNSGVAAGQSAGGVLEIKSAPFEKDGFLNLNLGAGSYGLREASASAHYQFGKFRNSSNFFSFATQNNYPYSDVRGQRQIRQGAGMVLSGIQHQSQISLQPSWTLKSNSWFQNSHHNLTDNILFAQSQRQHQHDLVFRQLLSLQGPKTLYKLAFVHEINHYWHPPLGQYDFNGGNSLYLQIEHHWLHTPVHQLQSALYFQNQFVWGVSKNGDRMGAIATISHQWRPINGLQLATGLRLDAALNEQSLPLFNFLIEKRLSANQRLRFSYAQTARRPALNDLYWQPGGNLDLKTEAGHMWEVGWNLHKRLLPFEMEIESVVFAQNMNHLIRWQPGQGQIWSPVNVRYMEAYGSELKARVLYTQKHFEIALMANWQYVYSQQAQTGGLWQVAPGLPRNRVQNRLEFGYKNWQASWHNELSDPWQHLPQEGYWHWLDGLNLHHVQLAYGFRFRGLGIQTTFHIQNLFNQAYVMQPYMPMPGRWYALKLNFNHNYKPKST